MKSRTASGLLNLVTMNADCSHVHLLDRRHSTELSTVLLL